MVAVASLWSLIGNASQDGHLARFGAFHEEVAVLLEVEYFPYETAKTFGHDFLLKTTYQVLGLPDCVVHYLVEYSSFQLVEKVLARML